MIGHLRGHLAEKRPNLVVVDVNGVGYQVAIPLSTFYSLGELRDDVTLLIHTHLREDSIALYGFLTAREKQFFELLLSASGVGPVLALKILSGMSVDELVPAIRANDLVRLVRIPGVGRKTAERIVVELRDKIAAMAAPEPEQVAAAGRHRAACRRDLGAAESRLRAPRRRKGGRVRRRAHCGRERIELRGAAARHPAAIEPTRAKGSAPGRLIVDA